MKIPPFLKPGDTIGIVSPAGKIKKEHIDRGKKIFESWGLNVIIGKNALNKYFSFAGNDEQRANDFQTMLNNKKVKAIICSRGGYGILRIMEKLDFNRFKNNPKWIAGFSDVSILHSYINNSCKTMSLHSPMPKNFEYATQHSIECMRKILFGENITYSFPSHKLNRHGTVSGILTGGNLSILHSVFKTAFDVSYKNKILFIEDLNENLYHIDRMIRSMRLRGVFNQIKGLIVGGMTDMKENKKDFGEDAYDIIFNNLKGIDIPVCFGFPAGHIENNLPLIMGSKITLDISKKNILMLNSLSLDSNT